MALALVLGLLVHAGDTDFAVVVGRRTSLGAADAHAVARTVSAHLATHGIPAHLDADGASAALKRLGVRDAAACNGRKACLTELGRQLAVPWLLALSVADVGQDRSLALELVSVATGLVAEKEALILSAGAPLQAEALEAFASRLRQRLRPPTPDRPVVEAPPQPPPLVVEPRVNPQAELPAPLPPADPPRSRVAPLVLGIAAGAALLASGILFASGLAGRAEAYRTERVDGELRSPWSATETRARASAANGQLGVAGGVGALGLGLGVATVITW